jgi:predicted DNA-binding ribbon-helix-helix protein
LAAKWNSCASLPPANQKPAARSVETFRKKSIQNDSGLPQELAGRRAARLGGRLSTGQATAKGEDVPMLNMNRRAFIAFQIATERHEFCVGMLRVSTDRRCVFMKSPVVKRSIVVSGHKTSVSLEDAFWNSLKEIGGERHMTLSDLVAAIDAGRQHRNLSSAIRLFVLDFYRAQLSEAEGRRDATERLMVVATPRPYS